MEHSIKVRETAKISVKPDLIIINMELVSHKYEYDDTMEVATNSVKLLEEAVESVGFNKKDLKTTTFNVYASYKSYYDKDNINQKEFDGYICEQGLKLQFDLDMDVLANVINAIAKSKVNPKLDIKFSVKNKDEVTEKLLVKATEGARKKAEVLSKASRVSLGKLISIDYNWNEINLYSPTSYGIENKGIIMGKSFAPNIEPDDISLSDTVVFVWQIK
ncbi:SIMPL domain-containing protein [Clostridium sp.]|uniref:SIMPL domain-containing protein n=1 Tax=Clostridium sp. TaxID=1506 RepID=UPI003F37532C